jgi:hypothetical protein
LKALGSERRRRSPRFAGALTSIGCDAQGGRVLEPPGRGAGRRLLRASHDQHARADLRNAPIDDPKAAEISRLMLMGQATPFNGVGRVYAVRGIIAGTPDRAGVYPVVLGASNADGDDHADLALTVED